MNPSKMIQVRRMTLANNWTNDYQRIPVRRFAKSQCLLGADHLLHVRRSFYIERYRRFYYRDIQSIVLQSNSQQFYKLLILGVLILLGFLSALINIRMLWITAIAALPFIMYILWLGPHCSVMINTAVQRETLSGLNTLKRAQKALAYLVPRIEEAQLELELEVQSRPESEPQRVETPRTSKKAKLESALPASNYNGWAHGFYYLLLLTSAGLDFSCFYSTHTYVISCINVGVMILALLFFLMALIKQQHSRLSKLTFKVSFISIGYWVINIGISCVASIVFSFQNPGQQRTEWDIMQEMLNWSPHDNMSTKVYFIVNISSALIFGLLGLLTFKKLPSTSIHQNTSEKTLSSTNPEQDGSAPSA
jgi:hypothetical protein